ncbi:UDP-N-acetyl-D-mannosaminuronic acid dehydrogenase [Streptomyces sp. DSM 42143]|uniref:nucleotide sugar dehydrogenase n=1 Tax=Streptomyces TaxID=1883 RepID=UPI0025B057DB|nr:MULTISPECIES: nucleotide sugar dehydrogenase [unclassified Streptomyces]MDN3245209.1 nucleotide sugar dehydrogenase [Streptomyces sp. ZSW22]MDQ0384755.1 UDP-N-acetyl-D-mannosaminuronic acid dehydrogenase [Streptomyces sp. DSM 42143]
MNECRVPPENISLPERPTVAVVGLGYVGSCVAATLADRGLDVIGVDIDVRLVDELGAGVVRFEERGLPEMVRRGLAAGRLRVTDDCAAAASADVVLITVGTPVREGGALDDRQLRAACAILGAHARPGQLYVVKSTVPPGTTRSLVASSLEASGLRAGEDFLLAYSPERLAESTALAELRTLPIVVGGIDERSSTVAAEFWRRSLGVEVIAQDSLEAAETVKLADNWWIDVNIALANELAKFCALYGVDVLDVIAAANSIPKGDGHVNILRPGVGVGGSCLTKDPWMVWHEAARRDLDIWTAKVGRTVNDGMPEYSADLIVDGLASLGKGRESRTVAILGLAFKNDTGDLRSSPVRGVIDVLTKAGLRIRVHDPLVDPDQAEELLGIRPDATVEEAVRDADCVAVLALHRPFRDIDFAALPVARPCLLMDGRAYYSKERIEELRGQGYVYRGIGR